MRILLEILAIAVFALLAARLLQQPWRGRFFNLLKGWLTIRTLWLLLEHPVSVEGGATVPAWQLVWDLVRQIDARVFLFAILVGAVIRMAGVMASMYRWQLVLRGQGIELPFRHIFGSFLIGRAIGFFLPSTAGLDAYKLYDAARFSGKTVEVTAGTALEKVVGFSGIFLSFLVALPFGIAIFGENAGTVAAITVPISTGVILALMLVLWYPGLVQWGLENFPIPGKDRLEGLVLRLSRAAAAYRDRKSLVVMLFALSFAVHFCTAAMYYFMAIAVGAGERADFWPIAFGSSIQIFATVISPFTIGGLGIREAAQYAVLGNMIGPAAAIVSATLGFWVGEFPTLFGFVFWFARSRDYTPSYCLVDGVQVDYEEAAKAATSLETEEEIRRRRERESEELPPFGARVVHNAGLGMAAGIVAGLLIGIPETLIIAAGGFGTEAQVLWYGPLAYAVVLGVLGTLGGAALAVLPMGRREAEGWTPALALLGCFVPLAMAITVFRLRRDVYLEQMPPLPVLGGVIAGFGLVALALFFLGPRLFRSSLGRAVRPIPALVLLAFVVAAGFAASSLAPSGAETSAPVAVPAHLRDRPNVILVMIDTLRADHLSCYSATGVDTPHLCSLAADGGSRLEAFSHASWTKPATASLLTSLLPSSHQAVSKPATLSEEIDFVSEAMQRHGYTTGGIVSNINLAPSFGFDQGYDEYHYLGPDYLAGARESSSKLILYQIARPIVFRLETGLHFGDFYQDSRVVNEVAFDWLERHRDSRFFLFLHYMDPHDPYFRHPYDGYGVARATNQHPDPERAAELHELYRGEIEYVDQSFGELLEHLHDLGLWKNTLIALVADHGEEFYEHEGWWHGLTLYEEQIHVPLLVKWAGENPLPEGAGSELARLIDVAPTLLTQAGAPIPPAMQGIPLTTPPENRAEKDRQHFAEEDHEGNVLWALRTKRMKLISANEGNPRGLPERALFDLSEDPDEEHNLADSANHGILAELERQAELQKSFAEGQAIASGEVEMTPDECEQLRMLGYVDDCSHLTN